MKIERRKGSTDGMAIETVAGVWTYVDSAVHARVLELALKRVVNVASIDDWIEGESWPDPDQLARVLQWRQRILDATDDDAAEGWGMFMSTLVALNVREQFLHPYAIAGKRHKEAQGVRRRDKPATSDDHDDDRNRRIRAMHSRLCSQGRRDATAETARAFDLTPRQIRRIVKPQV